MDTGHAEKEGGKDYRPGFMQHFEKNDEQKKKRGVGRKQPLQGPHNISYYFPDVPEGVDFRDHVSFNTTVGTSLCDYGNVFSLAQGPWPTATGGAHGRPRQTHGPGAGGAQETLSPEEAPHPASHGHQEEAVPQLSFHICC